MRKTYLGDSVYVQWWQGFVVLTTENGIPSDPSNRIALDRDTLNALAAWIERELRNETVDGTADGYD